MSTSCHAHGEEWARNISANEVFVGGVRDAMLLDDGAPDGEDNEGSTDRLGWLLLPQHMLPDRMRPYACYTTLLLYGPQVQGMVRELWERVQKISMFQVAGKAMEHTKKWLCGASPCTSTRHQNDWAKQNRKPTVQYLCSMM